jgi:rhodanese-related sulfurtransferase
MHDVAEAAKDPSAAEFLVIDVRSRASFAKGHVRGAFSLPLTDLAHEAVRLPHGLPLVTYCGGGT